MAKKYIVIIVMTVLIIGAGAVYYILEIYKNQSSPELAAPQKQYTIMKDSVDVEATIDTEGGDDPALKRIFEINLNISRGKDNYNCETVCEDCDSLDDVLDKLKESIAWKGKYLFVPTSCGSGNAWRCDIMQIFMMSNDRLIKVGEAEIDTDKEEYKVGKFHDIYDKLESNDLTCHADAPGFDIVMYENNGTMVANLTETWEKNQERYKENQSLLAGIARDSNAVSVDDLTKLPPLLYNSVLSKYCQKQDDLNRCSILANQLLDHDSKSKLDSILSIVVPGELH